MRPWITGAKASWNFSRSTGVKASWRGEGRGMNQISKKMVTDTVVTHGHNEYEESKKDD